MTGGLSTADLASLVAAIGSMAPAADDADRIERVRQFEVLKAAVAAAQAVETAAFSVSQKAAQAVDGEPSQRQGRGVAAQIGLARRVSPWQAQRYVGWCAILTTELPATFAALREGRISEWRAMIVARETIWLSREQRAEIDAELAPRLDGWGDRRLEAEVKRVAYRLDPEGFIARSRAAVNDRRVSIQPAPDCMTRLTALLPVAQGVACYAALTKAADLTTSGGDERGRGQIMADTLVERLTGQAHVDTVPVEINLVMSDDTLLADSTEPAHLQGYGPIPAGIARDLAVRGHGAPRWIRRLYAAPGTGQLVALESRRRTFTPGQRRFLQLRDQSCRTPWCDAPIRHHDHIRPHDRGGPTAVGNGDGLCEACNYARQAPGWSATPGLDGEVRLRTPTGHRYRSRPPELPAPATGHTSPVEGQVIDYLFAA